MRKKKKSPESSSEKSATFLRQRRFNFSSIRKLSKQHKSRSYSSFDAGLIRKSKISISLPIYGRKSPTTKNASPSPQRQSESSLFAAALSPLHPRKSLCFFHGLLSPNTKKKTGK
mmetsp:Transcript_14564/g.17645  ORF Transcript_14564/g.17645 Transcript_14564/m.17645 type:complete len:115 (+) Transcript_14564:560-904(+)